jgi:hypothetical protein
MAKLFNAAFFVRTGGAVFLVRHSELRILRDSSFPVG